MRRTLLLALSAAILLNLTVTAETSTKPFSLALAADPDTVRQGTIVELNVTMINTSEHDVDCASAWNSGANYAYGYEVRDQNGALVPRIKRPHPEISDVPTSLVLCTLKPGKSNSDGSLITRLYDLNKPGR